MKYLLAGAAAAVLIVGAASAQPTGSATGAIGGAVGSTTGQATGSASTALPSPPSAPPEASAPATERAAPLDSRLKPDDTTAGAATSTDLAAKKDSADAKGKVKGSKRGASVEGSASASTSGG